MAWAADFSSAQLDAAHLLATGYVGAIRYITGFGKEISAVEFANLTTTPGMSLALVMETGAQSAQGGFAAGVREASAAFARADALGWPKDRPIYFVGEDPNWMPLPQPLIEAYFRGVGSVVAVSRIGDYGSANQIKTIMALGLVTYGWPVETWPGNPGPCHIRQFYNAVPGAPSNLGGQVDPNLILKADWGQWSALTPPTPPPPYRALSGQEPAAMIVCTAPDGYRQDMVYIAPDGAVCHAWSDHGGDFTKGGLENLGGTAKTVSATWTVDGHFRVYAHGSDDLPHVKESDGVHWLTDWITVLPAVTLATPTAGPPGPAGKMGPPGPRYDDSWRRAAGAAIAG